jgi:hypothetical protein
VIAVRIFWQPSVCKPCCFLLPAEEPAEAEPTPKKKKKKKASAVVVGISGPQLTTRCLPNARLHAGQATVVHICMERLQGRTHATPSIPLQEPAADGAAPMDTGEKKKKKKKVAAE